MRLAPAPADAAGAWQPQKAMGIVAGSTLGRVWLMATAVLLVGIAERESGLAAAILLAAPSFTISFAAQGLAHCSTPGARGPAMERQRAGGR